MIKRTNGQVHLTGQDEVIFMTILFLMNLFLDGQNATRSDVNRAIYYYRDQGLPLDEWLFDLILRRWDTRLAWGTPARDIVFPLDEHDPAGGVSVICRARRREIWIRLWEAVECRTAVSAPPWLRNTPEFSGDLPSSDAMLTVMAEICGSELLDRLTELTQPGPTPAPVNYSAQTSKTRSRIEGIFDKLKNDLDIEIGFRPRRWLKFDQL